MSGPLTGVKVVEFEGIGPGPFCGMLLSDLGADVIRIDGPRSRSGGGAKDVTGRGRRSISLDLKNSDDVETCLKLLEKADALIEGYRPGVLEKLGLGPDVVLARNAKLVYGRMTGWGQFGPMAKAAGHDLNYIALTGALWATGREGQPPAPPLNLTTLRSQTPQPPHGLRAGSGSPLAAPTHRSQGSRSYTSLPQPKSVDRPNRGRSVSIRQVHWWRPWTERSP